MAKDKNKEKEYNAFQVFFYIVFIPSIFVMIVTLIILSVAGYDIKNTALTYGNKIPYLEKYIPEPEVPEGEEDLPENKVKKLAAELEEKESKLAKEKETKTQVEEEVTTKDEEIKKLNERIAQLEKELEGQRLSDDERKAEIKKLSDTYSKMEPANAAVILEEMNLYESSLILYEMDNGKRAPILETMNPTTASDITTIIKELGLSEDPEVLALQKQVLDLMKRVDDK